jgi:tRNA (pseudouridine54-N1)-methyltransferase
VRRFVIIGRKALASDAFRLDDLAGTSGRLDVLLRCVRAAIMVSHGVRRDVVVYLVLQGGPRAPRVLRVDAAATRFLRPDERSLATLVKKGLGAEALGEEEGFVEVRPGIAVRRGAIDEVIAELAGAQLYVLEPAGSDLRLAADLSATDAAFFVGDHLGLDEATRARLATLGAAPLGVGPVALHAEDVVTIVSNELDRRETGNQLAEDTPSE